MASFLIDCPKCRTTLQLPPGAQQIRCMVCSTIISIGPAPGNAPPPLPSSNLWPGSVGNYGPPAPYVGGPPPFPPQSGYQPPFPPQGALQQPPRNYGYDPPGGAFVRPEIPADNLPPPNPYQYTPSMPSYHGQKRAVVCGISYLNQRYHLKGCINDARCIKYLLTSKLGFKEEQILMLTEEDRDPLRIPTRYNIMSALFWLMQGQQAGDSLIFHYSGHGGQQRNRLGDEVDGYDETICPVDFEANGQIVDDELNRALVNPLQPGVRLHAIVDACHSGSILDLPFVAQINQYNQVAWEDQRMGSTYKGTAGGEAFSFSGCEDAQTSADTAAFSGTVSTGAMTYSFIQAIERNQAQTYGALLSAMRQAIKEANASLGGGGGIPSLGGGGLLGTLLGSVFSGGSSGGLTQIPQLSSDRIFDLNRPFSL